MRNVGVYEAKTKLPRLLSRVARGDRITITKHGVPIARLVPASGTRARSVEDVIQALLEFRKGRSLGRLSLRKAVATGRR
jgi:prevent-host-death family protein